MTEPLEQWAASVLEQEALDAELVAFEYAWRLTGIRRDRIVGPEYHNSLHPTVVARFTVLTILGQQRDWPLKRINRVMVKGHDYARVMLREIMRKHSEDQRFVDAWRFGQRVAERRGQAIDTSKGWHRAREIGRPIEEHKQLIEDGLNASRIISPDAETMADLARAMRREILNCSKRGTMQ